MQVNGGLFQAGDCHGTQGDSEYDGGTSMTHCADACFRQHAVLPAAGVQSASHAAIPLLLTELRFTDLQQVPVWRPRSLESASLTHIIASFLPAVQAARPLLASSVNWSGTQHT